MMVMYVIQGQLPLNKSEFLDSVSAKKQALEST